MTQGAVPHIHMHHPVALRPDAREACSLGIGELREPLRDVRGGAVHVLRVFSSAHGTVVWRTAISAHHANWLPADVQSEALETLL